MREFEIGTDSRQDVILKTLRLSRAIIGQIHRMRGASPTQGADFAVDAWEKIVTRDYVAELATTMTDGATAANVIARLKRDAIAYLNDCAKIDLAAGKMIVAAREMLNGAIDAVMRHS